MFTVAPGQTVAVDAVKPITGSELVVTATVLVVEHWFTVPVPVTE